MRLTDDEKEEIILAIERRKGLGPCAACGHKNFRIVDRIARISVAPPGVLDGPSMPCAVIVCTNCGNSRFHALHVLGLMDLGGRSD